MHSTPDRGEKLGDSLGITEKCIRQIGEHRGTKIYYDPYSEPDSVITSRTRNETTQKVEVKFVIVGESSFDNFKNNVIPQLEKYMEQNDWTWIA